MDPAERVVLCVPTLTRPYQVLLDSIEAALPVIEAAGWEHAMAQRVGCPYISHARSEMLREAMDVKADVVVFLDHDMGFRPQDLLKLIETEGDVVAGTYRFKKPEVEYMGVIKTDAQDRPICREDGCIRAERVPAGFLKVTKEGVRRFMKAYPELLYGDPDRYSVDLFNHGVHEGVWWGEDYAFSRRWNACGGQIWLVPDLNLDHHAGDTCYPGNFHLYLGACPGGALAKDG